MPALSEPGGAEGLDLQFVRVERPGVLQVAAQLLRGRIGLLPVHHGQLPDPPEPKQLRRYLQDTWSLNPDELEIEALSTPWFREGGHQSRFAAPMGLGWQQQTLLTLKEEK